MNTREDFPIDVFIIRWNKHRKVASEETHTVMRNSADAWCAATAEEIAKAVGGTSLQSEWAYYEVWNASGSRKLVDVREIN